jgi:hypothetical protein
MVQHAFIGEYGVGCAGLTGLRAQLGGARAILSNSGSQAP